MHKHRLIYIHAFLWKTHPWHRSGLHLRGRKTPPPLRELQREAAATAGHLEQALHGQPVRSTKQESHPGVWEASQAFWRQRSQIFMQKELWSARKLKTTQ